MEKTKIKNKEDESQDFYKELDNHRARKSCCTFGTLAILLGVILIIGLGIVLYLYFQISRGGLLSVLPNYTAPKVSFSDKLNNLIPTPSSQIELKLNSGELSDLLDNGLSLDNFILKDIRASINENNILIYATMLKPISSRVVATAVPEVQNGQIILKITNLTWGNLNFPKFLSEQFSGTLSGLLNQKLELLYQKYTVKKVTLSPDLLTILGELK